MSVANINTAQKTFYRVFIDNAEHTWTNTEVEKKLKGIEIGSKESHALAADLSMSKKGFFSCCCSVVEDIQGAKEILRQLRLEIINSKDNTLLKLFNAAYTNFGNKFSDGYFVSGNKNQDKNAHSQLQIGSYVNAKVEKDHKEQIEQKVRMDQQSQSSQENQNVDKKKGDLENNISISSQASTNKAASSNLPKNKPISAIAMNVLSPMTIITFISQLNQTHFENKAEQQITKIVLTPDQTFGAFASMENMITPQNTPMSTPRNNS